MYGFLARKCTAPPMSISKYYYYGRSRLFTANLRIQARPVGWSTTMYAIHLRYHNPSSNS